MPGNHLEQLVAEFFELRGYFVRRNVKVGPRRRGGYECELDIVAFHPGEGRLVHIEPSVDSHTWRERERRYSKKFEAGRRYIPELFEGMKLPEEIDQIALFVYGGPQKKTLAGGRVVLIQEFMSEVLRYLRDRPVNGAAVPEGYPLLRTLQFAAQYWPGCW